MTARAWAAAAAVACAALPAHAQVDAIDARPLPLAAKRLPASADECAVWRREQAFARSVESHDARAFYFRLGYAQAQLLPGYYGGRETSVRMVKDFSLSRTGAL